MRAGGRDWVGGWVRSDARHDEGGHMNTEDQDVAASELILYRTEDAKTHIQVRLEGGNVWLTQAQLAELYQTTPQNITLHLKALYEEGEVDEDATCKDYLQVRKEGAREVRRTLRHYSLG